MANAPLAKQMFENPEYTEGTLSFNDALAQMRGEQGVIPTYTLTLEEMAQIQGTSLEPMSMPDRYPFDLQIWEDGQPTGYALGKCVCGHNSMWHSKLTEGELTGIHVGECQACKPGQCTGYVASKKVTRIRLYPTCWCGHTSVVHENHTGRCGMCVNGYCSEMNPDAPKNFQIGE